MLGRRDAVAKAEHELEQLNERINAEHAERATYADAIANALAARDELADREASGEITAQAAAKKLAELETAIAKATAADEHRARVITIIDSQRDQLERNLATARYAERREAAETASEEQAVVSQRFVDALSATITAGEQLAASRTRAHELRAAANELRDDQEAPATVDESGWPDPAPLVVLLERGPARPNAAEASEAEKVDRERRAEEERAERLRAQAERILDTALDEQHLRAERRRRSSRH